ncbi:MAG: isopenicillin N synthase family oxygenase [Oceanospirillaceae bacterium]|nr:isopenicillin N synthase family oxygenase [Oceanospirillaceae bacterium]
MLKQTSAYALDELNLELTLGQRGQERQREVPLIDLSDFDARRDEITEQLWEAAADIGFFQLVNHGIEIGHIRDAFSMAEQFFGLPEETKARYPLRDGQNAGWETRAQIRPSTGTADQKESYQVTLPRMEGLWPEREVLGGFQHEMLRFEARCHDLGMKVMSCFADRLGFERNFFTRAHDPASETYQSTLRLLHYYALPPQYRPEEGYWRAGAHTDFDCLTMVFQQTGQGGLQLCPGKEAGSNEWTSVQPDTGIITCNIGDMLMRWSDDALKSTLHRVRMPETGEYTGARFSLAYFCQANKDVVIEGPKGKYPPITAADYLRQRIEANFGNRG